MNNILLEINNTQGGSYVKMYLDQVEAWEGFLDIDSLESIESLLRALDFEVEVVNYHPDEDVNLPEDTF